MVTGELDHFDQHDMNLHLLFQALLAPVLATSLLLSVWVLMVSSVPFILFFRDVTY